MEIYLRHMMRVMDFDVRRRGRLVTEGELSEYTRWLAIAVTEAMHYFIGNGASAPANDPTRYMAVSGAHILHMLRDTYVDLRAGYFNIPGEVLGAAFDWPGGRPQRCVSRVGRSPGPAGRDVPRIWQGVLRAR